MKNANYDKQSRELWLDTAKGIGIILVVLGHLCGGYLPLLVKWIFSFHMPLFFVLSGYLEYGKKIASFKQYFKHKAGSLLWPYFTFGLCIVIIAAVDSIRVGNPTILYRTILIHLFGYSRVDYGIGVIWFLAVLFELEILSGFIRFKNLLYALIIFLIVGNIAFFKQITLPLYLNIVGGAIAFFMIGMIINYLHERVKDVSALMLLAILFILGAISIYTLTNNDKVDLAVGMYGGSLIFYYIGAISGSFVVILISLIICKFTTVNVFAFLGQETLIIMMAHFFVNRFLNLGFGLMSINLNSKFNGIGSIIQSMICIGICYGISLIVKKYTPWIIRFPVKVNS